MSIERQNGGSRRWTSWSACKRAIRRRRASRIWSFGIRGVVAADDRRRTHDEEARLVEAFLTQRARRVSVQAAAV